MTHGANPGLVSHFVKQALLDIARDTGHDAAVPTDREGWAALAADLGVKVIHIAERDTQVAQTARRRRGEFVNTWSIDGFVGEGCQPAELGWGSHEKALPPDGAPPRLRLRRGDLPDAPGRLHARAVLDAAGRADARLPDHAQRVDLDRRLLHACATRRARCCTARPRTTPTTPATTRCCRCTSSPARTGRCSTSKRLMMDEITSGMDELGVLLMGHAKGAYWYGSRLTIEEARALAPHNNATSLQVTASRCWPAWSGRSRTRTPGVVEADELDHARVLEICLPYLGEMVGVYSDWTPLQDRGVLFPEATDRTPGSSPTSACLTDPGEGRRPSPGSAAKPAKGREAL